MPTVILEPVDFVRVARHAQFGAGFGASGSSAGANAQTQTFNQGGGFGAFPGFGGSSGSQAGANAQTQSFNQGGLGGFGANAANAVANAGTFSNVR